jgi:CP family cyanate transporter-like MFS transporter
MSIRSKPTRPVTASLLQAAPIPQTSPLSVAADRAGMDIAFPIAMTCIVLVAIDLRPGIVSTGPILPLIREEFGLSHTIASLLTAIPDLLMGALALPTPWLARRLGRDRVILGALALLFAATLGRAFAPSTAWLLLATAGVGAGSPSPGPSSPDSSRQAFRPVPPSPWGSMPPLYPWAAPSPPP